MKGTKILSLLNENRIEELRHLAQDEIYTESLKSNTSAKKRYAAMKKYFTYHAATRTCLTKPAKVKFEDKDYISFTNSWSLVLTTESCGEIELFNEEIDGKYPDVAKLLRFDGIKKKINFSEVIAEAKSKGYRLNKGEVDHRFKYLMLYDGTYYKIGLIDATFGIIDTGETAMTYHPDGEKMPLTIQNDLGIAVIMPVWIKDDTDMDEHVVITIE